MQSVWGQEFGRPLWGDHVRRMQRILPAVAELRRQLPVPATKELRRRPRQPQPMPVLPSPEMSGPRNVQRR